MKIRIEKSFDRDIDGIKDKKALKKLHDFIILIEKARFIHEIPQGKKMKGHTSFYRIRIGDYRLGLEVASDGEVVFSEISSSKRDISIFPAQVNMMRIVNSGSSGMR